MDKPERKAAFIILILGFMVFFSILSNGFVYDDVAQISNNPLVHSLLNLPYFFLGGTFFDAGTQQLISVFYRPILSTVFAFLYTFSGGYPFLFHLFQVLLHCANALLVFLLFRKFFKEKVSLFFAILFLIHPINQEAVAYISDLQENLFFFFGVLTFFVSDSNLKITLRVLFINVFLLLGLLSKETAILFVPTLIVYNFFFQKKNINKTFFISIFTTLALYFYLYFYVGHVAKITDAVAPIMKASLFERMLTMPAIVFYYLKTFFFPNTLALGNAWVVKKPSFTNFYLPLIGDGIFFSFMGFGGLSFWKKNKEAFYIYIYFVCWFVFGIAMHMQLIPLDMTVADRWFYFPIVGLLGLFATICYFGRWQKKVGRWNLLLIGSAVILLLAWRTMMRNTNWVDTLTLCRHDLQIIPDAYNVQSVCGSQLLQANRYEESKQYFAVAAQLAPNYSFNWYQYGISYEYTGDLTKAREYYNKSIQLSNEVNAYVSLAATYLKYEHDPQKAKQIVEDGLKSYPNYQRLQLYLAVCEYKLNNKQSALEIATKANQLSPSPESQYVLNQILNDKDVALN